MYKFPRPCLLTTMSIFPFLILQFSFRISSFPRWSRAFPSPFDSPLSYSLHSQVILQSRYCTFLAFLIVSNNYQAGLCQPPTYGKHENHLHTSPSVPAVAHHGDANVRYPQISQLPISCIPRWCWAIQRIRPSRQHGDRHQFVGFVLGPTSRMLSMLTFILLQLAILTAIARNTMATVLWTSILPMTAHGVILTHARLFQPLKACGSKRSGGQDSMLCRVCVLFPSVF